MRQKNQHNIANSTIKVVASIDLDVSKDLENNDENKTIAQLLNEQKEKDERKER